MPIDDAYMQSLTKEQNEWFTQHPVAYDIVFAEAHGMETLKFNDTPVEKLQGLLKNMCKFGAANWSYMFVPFGSKSAKNILTNIANKDTDCTSLAEMLELMAKNIGLEGAKRRQIKKDINNDRIVTKEDLVAFDGSQGDSQLDYRWCFGDHWVVDFNSHTFDPTFNLEYATGEQDAQYLGWWAKGKTDYDFCAHVYYEKENENTVYYSVQKGTPSRAGHSGFCGLFARAARPATPPPKPFYTFNREDLGVLK